MKKISKLTLFVLVILGGLVVNLRITTMVVILQKEVVLIVETLG